MVWYKYTVDPATFTNENAISFYLLGVYMTDGCVEQKRNAVMLGAKDSDWVSNIRDVIHKDKPLIYRKNGSFTTLNFSSEPIKNWLVSWGCTPNKTLTLKIEKEIPKQFIPDFFRGIIDGDGSIIFCDYKKISKNKLKTYNYKRPTTYIISASSTFIDQLIQLIPKNINSNVTIQNKIGDSHIDKRNGKLIVCKNEVKRISINNSNAVNFLNYVYYNNCFAMPRKLAKANEIINFYKNKNIDLII